MAVGRLLIVVGQAAPSTARLPDGVRLLIDSADEILVISPTLAGRLDWLASATDHAKEQADERLRSVLGQLEEMGAEPAGAVGADDPLLAFDDAVAQFSPTHILIGLRDEDRAGCSPRSLSVLVLASLIVGLGLMIAFDATVTRVVGMALLLVFIVGAVFTIAAPLFLERDEE